MWRRCCLPAIIRYRLRRRIRTGFKSPIVVPAGTSTTVNVQLTIGASQQVIAVEAEPKFCKLKTLRTAQRRRSHRHNSAAHRSQFHSDFNSALESPSPLPNAGSLGRATVDVNVNGTRVADNSYQIDGEDA